VSHFYFSWVLVISDTLLALAFTVVGYVIGRGVELRHWLQGKKED
jgi:hypothetical protein